MIQPIYRSDGEWVAIQHKNHLFNIDREWIGFIVEGHVYEPYSGKYLGEVSPDRRLVRQRTLYADEMPPVQKSPRVRPTCPPIPASMPLAPLLRELPFSKIDLFEEFPERLIYISDTRPDME